MPFSNYMNKEPQYNLNIKNLIFGSLLVLELLDKEEILWKCACTLCGNTINVLCSDIISGAVTSCHRCKKLKNDDDDFIAGDITKKYWESLQKYCSAKNIKLNISPEYAWIQYLKQQKRCALTGRLFNAVSDKHSFANINYNQNIAILNRVDISKGFVYGNTAWGCKQHSYVKGNTSYDDLVSMMYNKQYSDMHDILVKKHNKDVGFRLFRDIIHDMHYMFCSDKAITLNSIVVSGGMDPPHKGHYRMLKDASAYGVVIVVLNSDEWLLRKKGYIFMPFEERKEILENCKYVDFVIKAVDSDNTVCASLIDIRPDYFGNGGDRVEKNTPELKICGELGIKTAWGLGGKKIQSSSDLVNKAREKENETNNG